MEIPEHFSAPAPSLLRHMVSLIYDGLLVIALIAVVNALALGIQVKLTAGEEQVLSTYMVQLLTLSSVAGFFCLFWLRGGQTLGMQAWRIKLVDSEGNDPTLTKALLRCLGAAVSLACLGLGYFWRLFDKNSQYWHDYISGTRLILLPKSSRGTDDPP